MNNKGDKFIKHIKQKTLSMLLVVCIGSSAVIVPKRAYALFGADAAAMIPFLVKLIAQAVNQYNQLKTIYNNAKQQKEMIESINDGLQEAIGLLETFSIEDEGIMNDLKSFKKALGKVQDLYGEIPEGKEELLLKLHDDTVAESIKIAAALKKYTEIQEDNSVKISRSANQSSPKGAARANVKTNAAILHTLNQLLKVNGQILKLQSENLALDTKKAKESNYHFNKVNKDLSKSFKSFHGTFKTPRFN